MRNYSSIRSKMYNYEKNTRVFGYFFLKILLTPWFLNRFS